jgi:hypothetical protein
MVPFGSKSSSKQPVSLCLRALAKMSTPQETAAIQKLDDLFNLLQTMSPTSSASTLEKFGEFFIPNCQTNLRGMREEPISGRQAAIDDLKDHLSIWHLDQRRVENQAATAQQDGGVVVFCQMKSRLSILGQTLDPFNETAVVRFVSGENGELLIEDLKMCSCRSPIVDIVQRKTGQGPYSREYLAAEDHGIGQQGKQAEATAGGAGCCD